jgi:CRP-like cAMP-binding protein
MADAVRSAQARLAVFGSVSPHERVREQLLELARRHGRVRSDGVLLDLPLTHKMLAWMVGLARKTVTVAVGRLEQDRFLTRTARGYLLDVPAESL